ncbi:MAG: hypothetical protein V3V33_15125 [Candidatus Lokiarchaeia archaeon]
MFTSSLLFSNLGSVNDISVACNELIFLATNEYNNAIMKLDLETQQYEIITNSHSETIYHITVDYISIPEWNHTRIAYSSFNYVYFWERNEVSGNI